VKRTPKVGLFHGTDFAELENGPGKWAAAIHSITRYIPDRHLFRLAGTIRDSNANYEAYFGFEIRV
jgi:hypothetical protein